MSLVDALGRGSRFAPSDPPPAPASQRGGQLTRCSDEAIEGSPDHRRASAQSPIRRVLVVDEVPAARIALSRALMQPGREVVSAGSAEVALARLDENAFDLVICDQRLSGTSGIELLEQVRAIHPSVARALVTGERDFGLLREAINRGGISFFLSKPWDTGTLRALVRSLLEGEAEYAGGLRRQSACPVGRGEPRVTGPQPEFHDMVPELLSALNVCESENEILELLVQEFGSRVDSPAAWWIDEQGRQLVALGAEGRPMRPVALDTLDGWRFERVERGRRAVAPRLEEPVRLGEGPGALLGSMLTVPARRGGRVLARLLIFGPPMSTDMRRLHSVAERIQEGLGYALSRVRQSERRRAAAESLTASVAEQIRGPLAAFAETIEELRERRDLPASERALLDRAVVAWEWMSHAVDRLARTEVECSGADRSDRPPRTGAGG